MTSDDRTKSEPGAAETPPVLELRDLEVDLPGRRGRVQVVDRVSWSVTPGKTVCVVGESGAGKSMSMYAAARLAPDSARTRGAVLFEGRDTLTMSKRELATARSNGGIGFVFQDPLSALNPVLSVGRQLREVIRLHQDVSRNAAQARARDLLEQVRIRRPEQVLKSYPHQLSGGMRQRVVIASALASEPHVLIADEPTTSLDAVVQLGILTLLQQLQDDRQLAMVVVTHDLAVARAIADTVVVMYAGRVVEHGTVEQVFARPAHPYTTALISASPRFAHASGRPRMTGTPPDLEVLPPGCRFAPRCAHTQAVCRQSDPQLLPSDEAGHAAACLWPGIAREESGGLQ